jgi:hypothetical protein
MRRLVAVLAVTLAAVTLAAVPANARNVQPPFHDYVISRHDILDGEGTYSVYASREHAAFDTTAFAYGFRDNHSVFGDQKWHWVGWAQLHVDWYLNGPNNVTMREQGWISNSKQTAPWTWAVSGALRNAAGKASYGGPVLKNCKPFVRGRAVPSWEVSHTRSPFCTESDVGQLRHDMSMTFHWMVRYGSKTAQSYMWKCAIVSPIAFRLSGKYWFGGAYNLPRHPFTCHAVWALPEDPVL